MGRGANTDNSVATMATPSRGRRLSIAEAFPMNSIMETIAENLVEVDGGLECPTCLAICAPQGAELPERALIGECQEHGRFSIDVAREYEDALVDYEDARSTPPEFT